MSYGLRFMIYDIGVSLFFKHLMYVCDHVHINFISNGEPCIVGLFGEIQSWFYRSRMAKVLEHEYIFEGDLSCKICLAWLEDILIRGWFMRIWMIEKI